MMYATVEGINNSGIVLPGITHFMSSCDYITAILMNPLPGNHLTSPAYQPTLVP